MSMCVMRYIGDSPLLRKGSTALVAEEDCGIVLVQFDFVEGVAAENQNMYCFGWHWFPRSDFENYR